MVREVRRAAHDDEPIHGRILCNVVDGCEGFAEDTGVEHCAGCDEVAAAHAQSIARKHSERAELVAQLDAIADGFAGEQRDPTDDERFRGRALFEAVQIVGSDIEKLTAAHAAVLADHTHPVFACSQHLKRLAPFKKTGRRSLTAPSTCR